MAKGKSKNETVEEVAEVAEDLVPETTNNSFLDELDFNLDEDVPPEPLIPDGIYHGAIVSVRENKETYSISWDVVLSNTEVLCSDGQTPVEGCTVTKMSWLPKPADKEVRSKNGRESKYESKLRMFKNDLIALGIRLVSAREISEAITNQDWIGLDVSVKITTEEYEGRIKNVVKQMKLLT